MTDDLARLIQCPSTKRPLERVDPCRFDAPFAAWGLDRADLTAWWSEESGTYHYPEVRGIPVLHPDTRLERDLSPAPSPPAPGPFRMRDRTNPEYYERFEALVPFKAEFFASRVRADDAVVVEWLSSTGVTLAALRERRPGATHVAVDLDFHALVAARARGLEAVCADAATEVFAPGRVDFAFSNSLHHLPDRTGTFFAHVRRSLRPGGRFAGVETQGFVSRLLLEAICLWPRPLLPYLFTEIRAERDLLRAWLARRVEDRLAEAAIPRQEWSIERTLTHVLYGFETRGD